MRPFFFFAGLATGLTFTAMVAAAWTGPTQSPPAGNADAPVNVGTTPQVKNSNLGVNGLAVFGNTLLGGATSSNAYLNFGGNSGSFGYGIRDNAGTLEFKNSGGNWATIQATIYNLGGGSQWNSSGSTIYYNGGNVGIGTNNPAFNFQVHTGTNHNLSINDNPAGVHIFSYNDANSGYSDLAFGFSGNQLYLSANGNVGIGTTNPQASLDVHGTTKMFGARTGISDWLGTTQGPAATDGFLVTYGRCDAANCPLNITVDADTSNPPSGEVASGWASNDGTYPGSVQITVPIRKGEYYRILCDGQTSCPGGAVYGAATAYFVPLGQ